MTRIFALALAGTALSLWAVGAKASDWQTPQYSEHIAPAAPDSPFYLSGKHWPHVAQGPAITRTLGANPQLQALQPPAPTYEYQWQHQPSPPAPVLSPPRFSHPQQGYYPRENYTPQQVPGYEYDFGGAGTYPPLYPIEGASWSGPRTYNRATSFSEATPLTNDKQEYAFCPL